jgi:2-methylcitrate dehydratase PrpD
MQATARVVEFARTATPPPDALAAAADQLDRFRAASATGAGSAAAVALTGIAGGNDDPLWMSWISGTAAASAADDSVAWVAVCAAADAVGEDDARTVAATAVGYEVAERVAEALGSTHQEAGWSVRATAGVIGAGAAAGRLMGLSESALRDTIGLCATQAAGLRGAAGTDAEVLQVGKAAGNAVEAALLGANGFTSAAEPLAGRRGMFALMSTNADPTAVTDRLGATWPCATDLDVEP